jgi:thiamine biosynthesis protein ThiS
MDLVVNGKPHAHGGEGRIRVLLEEIGATAGRVAVVVNGEVAPSSEWDVRRLRNGDTVEILVAAPGG